MPELALITLSALSGIISVMLGIGYWWTMRHMGSIPLDDQPDDDPPHVSVVIPARNEERDLERALRTVLAQRAVALEVVLVNDHSHDRTGAIAERLAAEDPRLRVLHDPPLPPGWLGKANAMRHGLEATTSPGDSASTKSVGAGPADDDKVRRFASGPAPPEHYVLLTDADVLHHPACLASAIREMRRQSLDFVSFTPIFLCESFWENALLPHCYIAGTMHFTLQGANDPRSPHAAAAGAFILTRRDVLDAIGGMNAIRQEMVDDIALAEAAKAKGFTTRLWRSDGHVIVRLFKGNRDAFWGLSKNIMAAVGSVWMAFPAMLLPIFVYWVPIVTFALGCRDGRLDMIVAGLVPYLIQAALLGLVRPMCRMSGPAAFAFPLAVLPVTCCFLKAIYHRLASGGVSWRGRVIAIGKQ